MEENSNTRLRSMSVLSQAKLAHLLDHPPSGSTSRDLHIHPDLIKPFEKICGASWLRQHSINKIFKLDTKVQMSTNFNRVYLIPSCLIQLKHVLDQINGLITSSSQTGEEKFALTVIVVPKILTTYESLLEEEGLSEIVTLKQFQWEFFCMDDGVISLELPSIFKSVFIDKEYSLLSSVSSSLWSLFRVMGDPKIFVSVGKVSAQILEMYDIVKKSFGDCGESSECDIGALMIMDRDQDIASALLTPGTYNGLLYEIFDVDCGEMTLTAKNTKYKKGKLNIDVGTPNAEAKEKDVKMTLDSSVDSTYAETKYLHFSSVFSVLCAKAKKLNAEGSQLSRTQLSEMKHMITTKLQEVMATKRCLSNHIAACETILSTLNNRIEDLQTAERGMLYNISKKENVAFVDEHLCTEANKYSSLKLFCLLTLTQGITVDEYNSFMVKYLHAFGYEYLYVFNNLTTAGLIVPPSSPKFQLGMPNISSISEKLPKWQNNFQTAVNRLKQLPSETKPVNLKEPDCASYVFNGTYIPLVAAITKILLATDTANDLITKLSVLNDVKVAGPIVDRIRCGIDELGERLSSVQLKADGGDLNVACKDLKTFSNYVKKDEARAFTFPLKPRSVMVFVVGGVTQAEIAACHMMGKLTAGKIIVSSDRIITGESLMRAAM